MATVLERTLREKVIVSENGRKLELTKLEAAVKRLVDKATSGDLKAFQQLASLVKAGEQHTNPQMPSREMSEPDQKVMQSILKRFEASYKENDNREPDTK